MSFIQVDMTDAPVPPPVSQTCLAHVINGELHWAVAISSWPPPGSNSNELWIPGISAIRLSPQIKTLLLASSFGIPDLTGDARMIFSLLAIAFARYTLIQLWPTDDDPEPSKKRMLWCVSHFLIPDAAERDAVCKQLGSVKNMCNTIDEILAELLKPCTPLESTSIVGFDIFDRLVLYVNSIHHARFNNKEPSFWSGQRCKSNPEKCLRNVVFVRVAQALFSSGLPFYVNTNPPRPLALKEFSPILMFRDTANDCIKVPSAWPDTETSEAQRNDCQIFFQQGFLCQAFDANTGKHMIKLIKNYTASSRPQDNAALQDNTAAQRQKTGANMLPLVHNRLANRRDPALSPRRLASASPTTTGRDIFLDVSSQEQPVVRLPTTTKFLVPQEGHGYHLHAIDANRRAALSFHSLASAPPTTTSRNMFLDASSQERPMVKLPTATEYSVPRKGRGDYPEEVDVSEREEGEVVEGENGDANVSLAPPSPDKYMESRKWSEAQRIRAKTTQDAGVMQGVKRRNKRRNKRRSDQENCDQPAKKRWKQNEDLPAGVINLGTTQTRSDGETYEHPANKKWKSDERLRGGAVEWEPEQYENKGWKSDEGFCGIDVKMDPEQYENESWESDEGFSGGIVEGKLEHYESEELAPEQQAANFLDALSVEMQLEQKLSGKSANNGQARPHNSAFGQTDSLTHTGQPAQQGPLAFEKSLASAVTTHHEHTETISDRCHEFPADTEDRQATVKWLAERATQLAKQQNNIQDSSLALEENQSQVMAKWMAERAEKLDQHEKMMEEYSQAAEGYKKMVEEYRKMGDRFRTMCEHYQEVMSDQNKKISESASVLEAHAQSLNACRMELQLCKIPPDERHVQ